MPVWIPSGGAGVNGIAFPIILIPLSWALAFFYACLEENLVRAATVLTAATIVQTAVALAATGG
jgi:hypothetical protein